MTEELWLVIVVSCGCVLGIGLSGVAMLVGNEIAWKRHIREVRKMYVLKDEGEDDGHQGKP